MAGTWATVLLRHRPQRDDLSLGIAKIGGRIRTATQVAYWTSLLTVAQRLRDTQYPAFLLVDSPRLALSNQEQLSAALYSRLVALADANRHAREVYSSTTRLQIIIADNELPASYRRDYAEIDFTYESPRQCPLSSIPGHQRSRR